MLDHFEFAFELVGNFLFAESGIEGVAEGEVLVLLFQHSESDSVGLVVSAVTVDDEETVESVADEVVDDRFEGFHVAGH